MDFSKSLQGVLSHSTTVLLCLDKRIRYYYYRVYGVMIFSNFEIRGCIVVEWLYSFSSENGAVFGSLARIRCASGWVVGLVREILPERFVLCVKMANIVYTSDC